MNKLTLPLEVGKKYVCRDGTIVDCYAKAGPDWAPGLVHIRVAAGKPAQIKGTIWQDTGSNGKSGGQHHNDIVADYVEVTGHMHAELMTEYAKDAAQSTEPWKNWEVQYQTGGQYSIMCTHPEWSPLRKYRRKAATVTINDIVVKKGLIDAKYDELVYITTLTTHNKYVAVRFEGIYRESLNRGLLHSTKEDAIAMADAMLAFTAD